ncbi:CapA family protein [Lapidilactobacillus concavus]|jgi:poly-gamma-glutamate synthesis protein (capsule biosynthesis protein)|nr:CapA family protein [Lapidilactobacillus concavus]
MRRISQHAPNQQNYFFQVLLAICLLLFLTGCGAAQESSATKADRSSRTTKSKTTDSSSKKTAAKSATSKKVPTIATETLQLTFMGDNTLGSDPQFATATSLPTVWARHGKDPQYFFKNVARYFRTDDLTIANLETTLTHSNQPAYKAGNVVFHFKGDPELVKALTASSIETVTVSNNHIYDYGQRGFDDTIQTLKDAQVGYFGEGYQYTTTIKGVKIGLLGYTGWTATDADQAKIGADIQQMRQRGCQVVIPYFHWGIERDAYPNDTQKRLAHAAIDHGADMVIGSHPHVIQSLEVYQGKLIAYSMSNFAFGGNSNPSDKRSFLLQANLTVKGADIVETQFRVIPTRISSTDAYNDYVPTPYTGDAQAAVLAYINQLSPTLNGRISSEFVTVRPQ